MRLVLIGVAGGLFSALFGVGGGLVMVPLLILAAGFAERSAMATSLGAMLATVVIGVAFYAALGKVDYAAGALVGFPGMAGAVAGSALQQRVPRRTLSLLFAAFLTGVAVLLLVR